MSLIDKMSEMFTTTNVSNVEKANNTGATSNIGIFIDTKTRTATDMGVGVRVEDKFEPDKWPEYANIVVPELGKNNQLSPKTTEWNADITYKWPNDGLNEAPAYCTD